MGSEYYERMGHVLGSQSKNSFNKRMEQPKRPDVRNLDKKIEDLEIEGLNVENEFLKVEQDLSAILGRAINAYEREKAKQILKNINPADWEAFTPAKKAIFLKDEIKVLNAKDQRMAA